MSYRRIIDFSDRGEARFFEAEENGKNYVAFRAPDELDATATIVLRTRTKTVNTTTYAVEDQDRIILVDDDAAAGAVTVTLPAAADNDQRSLSIKKIGSTASVTIDPNASETIDEASSLVISAQYDAASLWCDGSNWWLI